MIRLKSRLPLFLSIGNHFEYSVFPGVSKFFAMENFRADEYLATIKLLLRLIRISWSHHAEQYGRSVLRSLDN